MTAALATTPATALTAADRCDRCGAQAYLRVLLPSGELLFCAHHGRRYADGLQRVAVQIHDETDKLSTTPATASDDER